MKVIPVQKGMIYKLGVKSIGSNGDLMLEKNGFKLFLKNPDNRPVPIGSLVKVKVVKLFEKLGYCELVK